MALIGDEQLYVSQGGSGNGSASVKEVGAWMVNFITGQGNSAIVQNNGNVTVDNSVSSIGVTGTANVVGGALTKVLLPATTALVNNGGLLTVQNSAGSKTASAALTVAAGVISQAAFSATTAIVATGDARTIPVTGTYTTTATFTVAAGVISAIVLS